MRPFIVMFEYMDKILAAYLEQRDRLAEHARVAGVQVKTGPCCISRDLITDKS